MAMTELGLLFLGAFAALASFLSAFVNLGKGAEEVQAFLAFLAAILWAAMGISSYDVIIPAATDTATPYTAELTVFIWTGYALGFIMFMFSLYKVFDSFRAETREADISLEAD